MGTKLVHVILFCFGIAQLFIKACRTALCRKGNALGTACLRLLFQCSDNVFSQMLPPIGRQHGNSADEICFAVLREQSSGGNGTLSVLYQHVIRTLQTPPDMKNTPETWR